MIWPRSWRDDRRQAWYPPPRPPLRPSIRVGVRVVGMLLVVVAATIMARVVWG